MSNSSTDLPEYSAPPVIEVVCSIQYEPVATFSSVHFGAFWQRVRDQYPRTEDAAPVESEPPKPEILTILPLRRVFYIDRSGNFLLQIQSNRFMANWRRMRDDDPYPHFEAAQKRFLDGWSEFLAFTKEMELGIPQAIQYELTYINHIVAVDRGFPSEIDQVLPSLSWKSMRFLPVPNILNMRAGFTLPEGKGTLSLTVNHGQRAVDKKQVLVLDLTARGPATPDWSDIGSWFSMAHEWIVRGFTDLTSGEAQKRWGRTR